jgi:hypothetical protein
MCYSFHASVISYTIGICSAIFALCTHQTILGLLILFYSQMQLSEAFIWKGIDNKNINMNRLGTRIGQFLLPTHNIAIGIGILLLAVDFNYIPLIIAILFYIMILFIYKFNHYKTTTYPANKSCHDKSCQENRLKWPFPHDWYIYSFVISLLFLILYIEPLASKVFLGVFFVFTFFASLFIYPYSIGSVWCFSTAILAPFLVIVNYFLIK